MNIENNLQDWDKLSKEQQHGILDAIKELDACGGEDSEDVIRELRKKYI